MGIWIDVWLGRAHRKFLHSMEGANAIEDGVRQGLLKIEPTTGSDLLDLVAKEIVVPRPARIVIRRNRRILEPNLDGDEEPLRLAHFEIVKADIRVHLERIRGGFVRIAP